MTTTLTTAAAPPLSRLVGVELRKLVDTRGMIATLAGAALVAGAAGGGKTLVDPTTTFGQIASMALVFVPYFLVGIGAALVTAEQGHRTAVTTFALIPRRGRILAAKAGALGILAVVAGALALIAAALIGAVVTALGIGTVAWEFDAARFGVLVCGLLIAALIGWALGMATGSMAITLAAYLVWPMVTRLIAAFSSSAGDALAWLQPDSVYALADGVDATVLAQAGTGLALWLLVPAVIGWARLTRGEIR